MQSRPLGRPVLLGSYYFWLWHHFSFTEADLAGFKGLCIFFSFVSTQACPSHFSRSLLFYTLIALTHLLLLFTLNNVLLLIVYYKHQYMGNKYGLHHFVFHSEFPRTPKHSDCSVFCCCLHFTVLTPLQTTWLRWLYFLKGSYNKENHTFFGSFQVGVLCIMTYYF